VVIELNEGLRSWRFFAFGRAVLPLFSFVVFALCERKNDKQMIVTYHAAAGKYALRKPYKAL
jgi:hypothetical protein